MKYANTDNKNTDSVMSECDQVSHTRQKIMTDAKAHLPIIDLIRDGIHHLQRIIYEDDMKV